MPSLPANLQTVPFSPQWCDSEGKPLACEEKEKLLNDNLQEILVLCQDALEDAVLMGCSETAVRQIFHRMIDALDPSF